ncbi:MAG: hypothetical protein JST40_11780 [Armatimonadetes bacterium]|nr:hypothetical protein [Armatimonadota bacterium]
MFPSRSALRQALICAVSVGGSAFTYAQPVPADFKAGLDQFGIKDQSQYSTLHFTSQVGSFKTIDCEGHFRVNFAGTLLLNVGKTAAVNVTGNVRVELDAHGRTVYFGRGTADVKGKWRGIQFFGKDIEAVFWGRGIFQLVAEFFKDPKTGDLVTGQYWQDDLNNKEYWFATGITTVTLPRMKEVQPKERKDK